MKAFVKKALTPILRPRNMSGDRGTYGFAHGTMQIDRIAICNHLIESHSLAAYLEIGCRIKSDMYDRILAKRKSSVDPDPEAEAEYCMTSDEFFGKNHETFDMVFIDGLHTGGQVRRDISNALAVLNPGGFILLHDMNPPTAFHAREEFEVEGEFPAWNGTSWEGYAWHRKNSPQLSMCVVDTDWGVGIVQNGKQVPWQGDTKNYPVLDANRKELLNLISAGEFLRRYPSAATQN